MESGIIFHDNGTIAVPIGDKTYTLKRPTTKQLFDFWDLIDNLRVESNKAVAELLKKLEELDGADEKKAEKLTQELRQRRRQVYETTTVPFLREAFNQLGSAPLPEDLTEAPSELTDPGLAVQILDFWRTVPLAHSPQRRAQLPR